MWRTFVRGFRASRLSRVDETIERHRRRTRPDHGDNDPEHCPPRVRRLKTVLAKCQQSPGERERERENRVLELDHVERQPETFQKHKPRGTMKRIPFYRMTEDLLRALLEEVRSGASDIDSALHRMRHLPFEDLGFAKVDHHRALRHGIPEVIFGLGKTRRIT